MPLILQWRRFIESYINAVLLFLSRDIKIAEVSIKQLSHISGADKKLKQSLVPTSSVIIIRLLCNLCNN